MIVSLQFVVEILVFSAVALMTVGTVREIERMLNQRRRLGGQGEVEQSSSTPLWARRTGENAVFRWVLASSSISDVQERQKLRQALVLAGIDSPNAPIWYVICRFSLAILLPALFLLLQLVSAKPATGFGVVFWPIVLCGIGLLAPSRILAYRASARQSQLEG